MNGKAIYDSNRPEIWLQNQRDYLSGRAQEIYMGIARVEKQTDEITVSVAKSYLGCTERASIEESSHRLWRYEGPLSEDDSSMLSIRVGGLATYVGIYEQREIIATQRLIASD